MRRAEPARAEPGSSMSEPPEHVWGNALAVPLPFAPELRKYSFYGIGVSTDLAGVIQEVGDDETQPRYTIDRGATSDFGFFLGDGDYSVPVPSLGFMCLKGWKNERRNPARIPCTIREYMDKPTVNRSSNDRTAVQAAKASGASPVQIV